MKIPYTFESYKALYSAKIKGKSHPLFDDRSIRTYQSQIKKLRNQYPRPRDIEDQKKIDSLIIKKKNRIEYILRKSAIDSEKLVTGREIPWKLKYLRTVEGRKLYTSNNEIFWKLAVLQTQNEIASTLPLAPNSRDYNIQNLINIINTQADIKILKLDISKYYDSISHTIIKSKIKELKISNLSKKIALKFIDQFGNLESTKYGIPQGISLSNQLAELYLLEFDNFVRVNLSVLYYSRYVDDIIIVLHENSSSGALTVDQISQHLNKLKLSLNIEKCRIIDPSDIKVKMHSIQNIAETNLSNNSNFRSDNDINLSYASDQNEYILAKRQILKNLKTELFTFTYLGYLITPTTKIDNMDKNLLIKWHPDLPDKKIKSLLNKIDSSFDAWDTEVIKMLSKYPNSSPTTSTKQNSYRARIDNILIQRLNYISSNYRLDLKRSHIVTGFYQSNKQSDCYEFISTLDFLDKYLQNRIAVRKRYFSGKKYEKNRERLSRISFKLNFQNKKFMQIDSSQFRQITKAWQ